MVCGRGLTILPSPPGPSSSPSLLTKGLSLEPSCSPCGHLRPLDAEPLGAGSASSLAEGAEPVNDTGPPELLATTTTPQRKSRLLPPGPKPQGKNLTYIQNHDTVMTSLI